MKQQFLTALSLIEPYYESIDDGERWERSDNAVKVAKQLWAQLSDKEKNDIFIEADTTQRFLIERNIDTSKKDLVV